MIREVIATGRDADSAIENGCRELGVPREEVEFEIISLPKKSFFGLKSYPAKVRVYQEIPDIIRTPREEPKAKKVPEAPKSNPPRTPQEPKLQQEAPKGEPKPRRDPRPQDKQEKQPRESREPREPREKRAPKPQEHREERAPAPTPVEIEPDEALTARIAAASAYLEGILAALGVSELEIQPHYYAENIRLQLSGTGLGVIIGRRGETLDALQYLTSLVANRGEGEYVRINIDSGNYREKRERTLENLARKLANQAVRTGKSTTLEPMNPYERRIIHGAVSQIKGATSSSIGVDPARRVVISPAGPKKEGAAPQGERSGDRRPRSRGGRSRSGDRDRRTAGERAPRTTAPREESQLQEQDLTQFTESIATPLVPPPPPRLLPLQDRPTPEAEVSAAEPKVEAAPAATPTPAEPPVQERKLDEEQVKQAPRYGKIEF